MLRDSRSRSRRTSSRIGRSSVSAWACRWCHRSFVVDVVVVVVELTLSCRAIYLCLFLEVICSRVVFLDANVKRGDSLVLDRRSWLCTLPHDPRFLSLFSPPFSFPSSFCIIMFIVMFIIILIITTTGTGICHGGFR